MKRTLRIPGCSNNGVRGKMQRNPKTCIDRDPEIRMDVNKGLAGALLRLHRFWKGVIVALVILRDFRQGIVSCPKDAS